MLEAALAEFIPCDLASLILADESVPFVLSHTEPKRCGLHSIEFRRAGYAWF
jgi:hypothetical protein